MTLFKASFCSPKVMRRDASASAGLNLRLIHNQFTGKPTDGDNTAKDTEEVRNGTHNESQTPRGKTPKQKTRENDE